MADSHRPFSIDLTLYSQERMGAEWVAETASFGSDGFGKGNSVEERNDFKTE